MERVARRLFDSWTVATPYIVAALITALATAVRAALSPVLGAHYAYFLFLFAAMFIAWYGGWKPALFALVLGFGIAACLFLRSENSWGLTETPHVVGFFAYLVVGVACIYLSESVRTARRRAEQHAMQLEQEILGHQRTYKALTDAHASLERRTLELSEANALLRQEIAARQQAEAGLRRMAAIVASSQDAIIGYDVDGTITDWNAGAERLYGHSVDQVIGQHIHTVLPPSQPDKTSKVLDCIKRGQRVEPFETARQRKDGSEVVVSLSVSPIIQDGRVVGGASIARDLTYIKRLEEQLLQAAKMEAVGRLAGGVAHDFNNLLTIIIGYADIGLSKLRPPDPLFEQTREIKHAAERAAELTRQLLAYSRKQLMQPRVFDLNALLSNMDNMLRRIIGDDMELTVRLAPNLGCIQADPAQLEQVVMNLAANARDAMPHGGTLFIWVFSGICG